MLKKWFSPEEAGPEARPVRSELADQNRAAAGEAAARQSSPLPASPPAAPGGRYSSFDQIYQSATNKLPRITYNVLKVSDMVNSEHLTGMSTEAKRSSLLMALEAAGVAIEDVLQDAVLRQRALSEYEEAHKARLKNFEQTKLEENAKVQAELEKLTKSHMERIQANLDEVAREQDNFRVWQQAKNEECDRLTEAAGYCVPKGTPIGANSLASVLERAALPQ